MENNVRLYSVDGEGRFSKATLMKANDEVDAEFWQGLDLLEKGEAVGEGFNFANITYLGLGVEEQQA
ncbi:MAG TPA: hypothetical protein DCE41_04670 [Cytophagales bacterium]|nr:hypothetical protein [Cytophagales bacterium]HAA23095.1 hypothetical protein [Cytophagales bacterium]HAP64292.1 hypothetical protein [Cytophagales bacterium]